MAKPVFIFAGGGTGGHLYPALAVAEVLRQQRPEAEVIFACSDRAIDQRILGPTGYTVVPQPIKPMPRSLRGWGAFLGGFFAGKRVAAELIDTHRPAAVFGLGGFAAFPMVKAAAGAGIPQCLLSIDAVPGLANRRLAKYVDVIFAQYSRTAGGYGANAGKAQLVGCPVRPALLAGDAEQARRQFNLQAGLKTLLIVPGSLGAANINDAIIALRPELDALAGQWQILHVTGPGKLEQVRQAYAGSPLGVAVIEFCDRMDLAYALADLVLCRAGASTIGELAALGRPAVLMPYPYHKDQHQRYNAEDLVSAGAAEVVADLMNPSGNAQALRGSLLTIMGDSVRLAKMQRAAQCGTRHDAARKIAQWLLEKAES